MRTHLSDEERSLAERRVLDSLVRLTESHLKEWWVYFPSGVIQSNMREYLSDERYGFIGVSDACKILNHYVKKGLVVRPMHFSPYHDKPWHVKIGGYRANHEKLDEIKELIRNVG